ARSTPLRAMRIIGEQVAVTISWAEAVLGNPAGLRHADDIIERGTANGRAAAGEPALRWGLLGPGWIAGEFVAAAHACPCSAVVSCGAGCGACANWFTSLPTVIPSRFGLSATAAASASTYAAVDASDEGGPRSSGAPAT
ncbi:hypothetical protein IAE22_31695, partial [Bacillus sp. S34]|nr:hypothetical protein [Bacillus sp. S34]